MGKKNKLTCSITIGIIAIGTAFLLVLLIGIGWYWYWSAAQPRITILQPTNKTIINSGRGLFVVSHGEAQKGIEHIDLFVDDEFTAQRIAWNSESHSFDATFSWFGSLPGIHKISVIAYDTQGRASQPSSVLVTVNPIYEPLRTIFPEGSNDEQTNELADQQSEPIDQPIISGQDNPPPDGSQAGDEQQNIDNNQNLSGGQSDSQGNDHNNAISPEGQQENENNQFPMDLPNQPEDAPPHAFFTSVSTPVEAGLKVSGVAQADDDLGLNFINFNSFSKYLFFFFN